MINTVILSDTLLLIIKTGLLLFLGLYILFAIIVIRQVKLMTDTLEIGLEGFIKFLSFVHLLIALVVFVLALFA